MAIRKIISRSIGVDVIAAEDLAAGSVETAEIQNGAVTGPKLADNLNYDSGTLYLDSTNNRVAIGSTSSLEKLRVAGNIELYNDDVDGYIWFHDGGTRSWAVGSDQSTGKFSINYSSDLTSAERLTIDSNGFTSLNTTTGNERLNVAGAIGSSGASANFGAGDERIIIDYTGTVARIGHVNGASGSAKPLQFLTAGGAKMTLSAGGYLGIGGTNPTSPLQVETSSVQRVATFISTSHDPQIYLGDAASADNAIILGYDRADNRGYLTVAGDSDSVLTITNGGNIGVGIANPASKLQAYNSGTLQARICDQSVNGHYFEAQSLDGTDAFTIYQKHGSTASRNSFIVKDNISTGRTAFAVRSDGHVLVGTTSTTPNPGISLQRDGNIGIGNSNGNSGTSFIEFRRNATQIGSITQNGTSGISVNTSSDYRLKENVEYDFDASTRLKQLKPARFNFIADADTTVDGFLAHEVQDIIPEAITGTKDAVENIGTITNQDNNVIEENVTEPSELSEGQTWTQTGTQPVYQGIDQSKLVPLLVKSLQEALTEIDSLKARLDDAGL
jgi:hypothetical protein